MNRFRIQSANLIRMARMLGLAVTLASLAAPGALSQITLSAFDFKKDAVWENRDGALGIVGNHKVTSGTASIAFAGAAGVYKVEFNVVLERDGDPAYKISAAGKVLKSGKYPYACGKLQCTATKAQCPDKGATIAIGEVILAKGDKLEVWGQSTYPCGSDHGAYCRWKSLKLTKVGNVTSQIFISPLVLPMEEAHGMYLLSGQRVGIPADSDRRFVPLYAR